MDTSPKNSLMVVRDIPRAWEGRLLALNNAHAVELSLLDTTSLRAMLDGAFSVRCIGNLYAGLIALDERHATYASPNYLWFHARYPRFVYVDRIVVAEAMRGKGQARRLYADLIERAMSAGHDLIVCEVNSVPPNPMSDAFHAALGSKEVGAAVIHGGAKSVRYLALRLEGVTAR